jgi:hypothetical protein
MKIKAYRKEKSLGWFSVYLNPAPNYVLYNKELYKLRPKHGLIQNDCYEMVQESVETIVILYPPNSDNQV